MRRKWRKKRGPAVGTNGFALWWKPPPSQGGPQADGGPGHDAVGALENHELGRGLGTVREDDGGGE